MIIAAMTIGFGLGAASATIAILFAMSQFCGKFEMPNNGKTEKDISNEREVEQKQEALQKQWENFMNYDGTEKGQMQIGEDDNAENS